MLFLKKKSLNRKELQVHELWIDMYKGEVYMLSFKENFYSYR